MTPLSQMRDHVRADEDDEDGPEVEEEEEGKEGKPKRAKKKDGGPPSVEAELFKARTVLIFGGINDKLAREVTARLLALDHKGADPIRIIISSPGGHVESGDTIHDVMRFVRSPVKVIGTGWVASAAAHIFLGARKGNRYCLPNTRFMLHQPSGGVRGPAQDIDIEAREIIKMRGRINQVIARETGQPLERVEKDTDRNFWMGAEEAKAYGLVDTIVETADAV
ncbi:MAG: ATP-dependent Clp protease proteolytic subunit [Alphaproteobacteria bacterium]|nr:ATP-dependent Clp protease proteolytic subunit [Alphaproteobacteria bacterium]